MFYLKNKKKKIKKTLFRKGKLWYNETVKVYRFVFWFDRLCCGLEEYAPFAKEQGGQYEKERDVFLMGKHRTYTYGQDTD